MNPKLEKAFEAYIEETLSEKGWDSRSYKDWDREKALFPQDVISFIKETQSELWQKMEKLHGADLPGQLIKALVQERQIKGTIEILRGGFKFYGKKFKMAYYKPAHGLNADTLKRYAQNRLTVTRQVPCHLKGKESVDMVLALNGIPVATVELKNPVTGQSWRDAVRQYICDRDPGAPLFQFKKGALVHFAVDTDEIYMATHLKGNSTYFLPFNRGSHPGEIQCGAGNPTHRSGHRTGYFWEDILERDSFLDIAAHFIFLEVQEKVVIAEDGTRKREIKETMIFPRFHQLDVVRGILADSKSEQTGRSYLIQHSAGSGKTNSISWLSHRLSCLHTDRDQKIFDCVIVVTDRQVLDKQLQDAVYQIEHAQGVVKAIEKNSRELAEALVDGTKIVVTTLQKFPFVLRGLLHIAGAEDLENPDQASIDRAKEWEEKIADRKYAVIVDEAHSSQSGETARELKKILGAGTAEAGDKSDIDWEDGLNQIMESRGRQKNISFFAFTATPKGKTLELFGKMGDSGKPEAFHTYSMRQAIQEKFILDVLLRYTTYKTYYKLVKAAENDPNMPRKKAGKKLAKFLSLHPHNIEQKTEIIIEHFRQHVKDKVKGKAKAMVVTGSRLHAVRYMLSFQKYLEENRYTDIRPLVAFSGTVKDPDSEQEYTEPGMNIDVVTGKGISEIRLKERFDTDDYQVLLVANKYQTGFNQPLLCAMYVDKRLDGVQAVQTLSRLNRTHPGKEPPFVLDFVNTEEGIYEAFKPYYDVTTLQHASHPSHLEVLKHQLDAMQVYHWPEVEAFAQIFYLPQYKQRSSDHARLDKQIQPSVDRFNTLIEEQQKEFYDRITAYKNFYAFVSQIIPYTDSELEMLYSFSRWLIPHLKLYEETTNPHPEKAVTLQYYRIEKVRSGAILLAEGDPEGVKSPTAVGTGKAQDEDKPLSEIIQILNDRFGTDFKEDDRLFFEQIKEKACNDERVIQTAQANTLDKFELGIQKLIEALMIQRMSENDKIVTRYMEDSEFQQTVYPALVKEIYKDIISRGADSLNGPESLL